MQRCYSNAELRIPIKLCSLRTPCAPLLIACVLAPAHLSHPRRAQPLLPAVLRQLCPREHSPTPEAWLTVLPAMLNTVVVLLCDHGTAASGEDPIPVRTAAVLQPSCQRTGSRPALRRLLLHTRRCAPPHPTPCHPRPWPPLQSVRSTPTAASTACCWPCATATACGSARSAAWGASCPTKRNAPRRRRPTWGSWCRCWR